MRFREAARLDDLWLGELRGVVLDGVPVLLVRSERGVHAYEDRCLHQAVRLSEGTLAGETITCSAHGWSYHACTGQGLNPSNVCLRSFPVRITNGIIEVAVHPEPEPEPDSSARRTSEVAAQKATPHSGSGSGKKTGP